MPKFPRHESQRELTTQQTSFLAPEDPSAKITEEVGKLGQQAQEIALKWQSATDTIQKTTAQAKFKSGMLDIQNRASNDPDYNNSDQYYKEIEKLRTESLQGFSSKQAQAEAALSIGLEAQAGQIAIGNVYRKKMVDVGQASTISLLEAEASNPGPDTSQRISQILGSQIEAGVFSHKDAMELQKDYDKKSRNNAFLNDLNFDPSLAKENLSKNAYGFKPDELKSAKGVLKTETKRQEKQLVEANNIGESNITSSIVSEDPAAYEQLERAALDPQTPAREIFINVVKDSMNQEWQSHGNYDDKTVESLLTQYSKVTNTQGLMNFRNRVYIEKPNLDEEKFKTLLSWTTPENEQIVVDKRNWIQKSFDWIKSKFSKSKDKGAKMFNVARDAMDEKKYVPGNIVTRGGRSFKIVKNDDGSLGFDEI